MREFFLFYNQMHEVDGLKLQALRKEFGADISFVSIRPKTQAEHEAKCDTPTAVGVLLLGDSLPLIPSGIALQKLPHVRFAYPGGKLQQVTEIVIKTSDRIRHRTREPVQ